MRTIVLNSHTNELITTTSPVPFGPVRVDVYNQTNALWVASPAPYELVDFTTTTHGNVSFAVRPGIFSVMSWISVAPMPLHGIGRQNINFTTGQDFFLTLYIVPRGILNSIVKRATVLTWQSIDTGFSWNFIYLFCFAF